jgi:hypothetical protein
MQLSSFLHICRVLDVIERFDLFIPESAQSPVEQLKLRGRRRQRASSRRTAKNSEQWRWGDEK